MTYKYTDLRDWLEQVEEAGELKKINGAHWDQEIGMLRFLARSKESGCPAVLFDEITDYPKGFRVLAGPLSSTNRIALSLGMQGEYENDIEFVKALKERAKQVQPIPVRVVKSGPIMDHIDQGDKVDMFKFPTPRWHKFDGGRYIGTGDVVITRDPDEGWVNLGTYRTMIQDKKTLLTYIDPGKHANIQREKYFSRGQNCPVVLCFGQDPLLHLVAGMEVPYGINELEYAGGLRGEPIDVIEGPVTGLPIPATAEIAVEAEIMHDEALPEGPFAEFTGYYGSGSRKEPVVRVLSVMYRNDPIISGLPTIGRSRKGGTSGRVDFRALYRSALIWQELEGAGIPDVKGVWCHAAGGSQMLIAVSIRQRYPGHAKQAGAIASQCHAGAQLGRYVFVLDDDVDPSYDWDVLWSLATRSDPERSIDILRRCWSGPLDMAIPVEDRGLNSRAIIECCRPYEIYRQFPQWARFDNDIRTKLEEKFGASIYE